MSGVHPDALRDAVREALEEHVRTIEDRIRSESTFGWLARVVGFTAGKHEVKQIRKFLATNSVNNEAFGQTHFPSMRALSLKLGSIYRGVDTSSIVLTTLAMRLPFSPKQRASISRFYYQSCSLDVLLKKMGSVHGDSIDNRTCQGAFYRSMQEDHSERHDWVMSNRGI